VCLLDIVRGQSVEGTHLIPLKILVVDVCICARCLEDSNKVICMFLLEVFQLYGETIWVTLLNQYN
jgi:uncharacterized membrane protein YhaH (DUF805 family)